MVVSSQHYYNSLEEAIFLLLNGAALFGVLVAKGSLEIVK